MAIAVNGLTGLASDAVGKTIQTTNFVPHDGSLLFAAAAFINNTALLTTTFGIIDSLTLTWNKRFYVNDTDGSTYHEVIIVWTTVITSGASMNVTVSTTEDNADLHKNLHIFDVTGANNASPFNSNSVSVQHTGDDGAFSATLPSNPAASSATIGLRSRADQAGDNQSATPGTGYTELFDTTCGNGYTGLQSQVRLNSTATSVAWADFQSGTTGGRFTSNALGFEVLAAAGAATKAPPPFQRRALRSFQQRFYRVPRMEFAPPRRGLIERADLQHPLLKNSDLTLLERTIRKTGTEG